MQQRHPSSIEDLRQLIGETLGPTQWVEIDQRRVQDFADVTGDQQWIHVDVQRATTELGGPIAHGLLTLSLGPMLLNELLAFDGFARGVNYGYDRVRFPSPLRVGSAVRMTAAIETVETVPGGAQISVGCTVEAKDNDKPVCVAQSVSRFYEA